MACRVAVLNSFMMVDASPVTHILWETNLFCSMFKRYLYYLLVAMYVVSGRTNQVQDI